MLSTKIIEVIKEVEPPKKKKKDEDVEKKSVIFSSLLKTCNHGKRKIKKCQNLKENQK
jgi:hypothetical protein